MRILSADVGGTKTALRLSEGTSRDTLVTVRSAEVESASTSALEPLISAFLAEEQVDAIGLGVAGPVIDGVCRTTNLPWVISADALRATYNTKFVALHNDVEAAAFGIPKVSAECMVWINEAPLQKDGLQTLATVGTGFGRALRTPDGKVFAAEGGHATFAPRTTVEVRLLEKLLQDQEHVAIEHVISGRGLKRLYTQLVEMRLVEEEQRTRELIEEATDPSAIIGELGIREADAACASAVFWLCELIGAELGNIALEVVPLGGLFLWGGVARKLKSVLVRDEVREAFLDKDRMRALLSRVPCALLDDPDLALHGAREAAVALLPA